MISCKATRNPDGIHGQSSRFGARRKSVTAGPLLSSSRKQAVSLCSPGGYDEETDIAISPGDYKLEIFPPPAFSQCLNTDALRFSEVQRNQVGSPALLLEFDDYFCGDDHIFVGCNVFTDITIVG